MGVLSGIVFNQVMGLPSIAWGGIVVGVLLLITFAMGLAISMGKGKFTMKQHKIIAIITVVLALGHGIVGVLAMLGY